MIREALTPPVRLARQDRPRKGDCRFQVRVCRHRSLSPVRDHPAARKCVADGPAPGGTDHAGAEDFRSGPSAELVYASSDLLTMLVTGLLMISSIPNKYYHSGPFWWKMGFFWVGVVFHFTLYRKVTRSDQDRTAAWRADRVWRSCLWYGTGAFGRAIGFY